MKTTRLLLLLTLFAACRKAEEAPEGCQFIVKTGNETHTYQFDDAGRVTQVTYQSSRNEVVYRYAYQGRQATLDITYPKSDWLWLRCNLTLNEQGYLLTSRETMFNRLANGTVEEHLIASRTCAYDAEGYLISHYLERYAYPFGAPRKTSTYERKIQYQDGNPVAMTYVEEGKVMNTYSYQPGPQPNPLKVPFLLESLTYSSTIDERALQPLLGKPSRNLVTRLELSNAARPNDPPITLQYAYEVNAAGFPVRVSHPNTIVPGPTHSLETTCR